MDADSREQNEAQQETCGRGVEDELRRAVAEHEARVREIVELAAHVRHEINNPLTGLIGQAQLLLRDDTLSENARRRVETIEQLAKRIRDTVAELRVVQHTSATRAPEAGRTEAGESVPSEDTPRH
jgi:signal transduction histidine kinase